MADLISDYLQAFTKGGWIMVGILWGLNLFIWGLYFLIKMICGNSGNGENGND